MVKKGTVERIQLLTIAGIKPVVLDEDVIATGFPLLACSTAVVLGPTAVGLSGSGTLYVADTEANRIAAIPDADDREFPIGGGSLFGLTVSPSSNGAYLVNDGNNTLAVLKPGCLDRCR